MTNEMPVYFIASCKVFPLRNNFEAHCTAKLSISAANLPISRSMADIRKESLGRKFIFITSALPHNKSRTVHLLTSSLITFKMLWPFPQPFC